MLHMEAGVRQGCPASPALYLIVALGLYRLLEKRGLGIATYGRGDQLHLTVAGQYADDTEAYLRPTQLRAFRETLEFYRLATGQRINWTKTKIIALGLWPAGVAPTAPAFDTVVLGHRIHLPELPVLGLEEWRPLNVAVEATQAPPRRQPTTLTPRAKEWKQLSAGPTRVLCKIYRARQLTMFGRASAVGAYAYQTSLYHAQLLLPCTATLAEWEKVATKVIHGAHPDTSGRDYFPACSREVLTGTMASGGFGLLPLHHHLRARLATFGVTLITGNSEWTRVYTATFRYLLVEYETPYHTLMLCVSAAARPWPPRTLPNLEPALDVLHHDEAMLVVDHTLLQLGPWCAGIPLWSNPALCGPDGAPWRPPQPSSELDLRILRLDTVGHLVLLERFLRRLPVRGQPVRAICVARPFRGQPRPARMIESDYTGGAGLLPQDGFRVLSPTTMPDPTRLLAALQPIRESIPPAWLRAATRALDDASQPACPLKLANGIDTATNHLVAALGFRDRDGTITPLSEVTVRSITTLYSAPEQAVKRGKLDKFLDRVAPADRATWSADTMLTLLERLAKVPCGNLVKEPYWLLVYNGVHIQARYASAPDRQRPCRCTDMEPQTLRHAFWDCPVALEIRLLLELHLRDLQLIPPDRHLVCEEVWLAVRPVAMARWVWDTVVLTAIYAMDQGRRALDVTTAELVPPGKRLEAALSRARRAFWMGLGRVAQTITLNKARADALAGAAENLGGRYPYLQPSRYDQRRVEPSPLLAAPV